MINSNLKNYLITNIVPLYDNLDLAHKGEHVYNVIETSLEIAKSYDVNLNMVYTIAVFHDVGLVKDRKTHHLIGGQMLADDLELKNYFTNEEIIVMQQAVEDHRASLPEPPRSIYGKIIAEADRSDDMETIIKRCFLFDRSKNGIRTFEESLSVVKNHLHEKYDYNGYLKVWLETKHVNEMLNDVRTLLKDEDKFIKYCLKIYNNL